MPTANILSRLAQLGSKRALVSALLISAPLALVVVGACSSDDSGGAAGAGVNGGTGGSAAGAGGSGGSKDGSAGTGGSTAGTGGSGGSSSDASTEAGGPLTCSDAGDMGPQDHCADADGGVAVDHSAAVCTPPVDDAGTEASTDDASAEASADDGGEGGGDMSDFGPTNCGTSATDDDCKYNVSFMSTSIIKGQDVTFTVTVKEIVGGAPVTGAGGVSDLDQYTYIPAHVGPKLATIAETSTPGVWTVSGVNFDKSGLWVIRFHIHAECADSESSPHGHAAFYINVP